MSEANYVFKEQTVTLEMADIKNYYASPRNLKGVIDLPNKLLDYFLQTIGVVNRHDDPALSKSDIPVDRARWKLMKQYPLYVNIYIAACCFFTIGEPVLVSYSPTQATKAWQFSFLGFSTILFIIGVYFTFCEIELKDHEIRHHLIEIIFGDVTEVASDLYSQSVHFARHLRECFDGQVLYEFCFLVFGWSANIQKSPGIAALRCFRIFRLFWYSELYLAETQYKAGDRPENHPVNPVRQLQLCLNYLGKIATELFSAASKGGFVILMIYFYITYIIAVVSWNLKGNLDTLEGYNTCGTLTECFVVIMRLSLYDGTGLDFLSAVIGSGAKGLVLVLIAYMCFNGMILLNGLIGVFGYAFQNNDDYSAGATKKTTLEDVIEAIENLKLEIVQLKKSQSK